MSLDGELWHDAKICIGKESEQKYSEKWKVMYQKSTGNMLMNFMKSNKKLSRNYCKNTRSPSITHMLHPVHPWNTLVTLLLYPSYSKGLCHVSRVTCHVSRATCHMSCVTCHIFFFFFDKVVEFIGGGSVINGTTPSSSRRHTMKDYCKLRSCHATKL